MRRAQPAHVPLRLHAAACLLQNARIISNVAHILLESGRHEGLSLDAMKTAVARCYITWRTRITSHRNHAEE